MKILSKQSSIVIVLNALAFFPLSVSAYTSYAITELPSYPGGTIPYDINDSGQVAVGIYRAGFGVDDYVTGPSGSLPATYYSPILRSAGGGIAGINDKGQAAGWRMEIDDMGFHQYAFYTQSNSTSFTYINTFGKDARANAINNNGQVVGSSGGYLMERAFITEPNSIDAIDLGTLGGASSSANDINVGGQVVGESKVASGQTHAFVTGADGLNMTDIGTLGGSGSSGKAINASGQVVGSSDVADGVSHAFLYQTGNFGMIDLGTLGGRDSGANDINVSGQIVGWSNLTGSINRRAFIAEANGGEMVDLNSFVDLTTLGYGDSFYFAEAFGINDLGQILVKDSWYGVALLTPISTVPIPGSIWLFVSAVLCLVGYHSRKLVISA